MLLPAYKCGRKIKLNNTYRVLSTLPGICNQQMLSLLPSVFKFFPTTLLLLQLWATFLWLWGIFPPSFLFSEKMFSPIHVQLYKNDGGGNLPCDWFAHIFRSLWGKTCALAIAFSHQKNMSLIPQPYFSHTILCQLLLLFGSCLG